MYCMPMKLKWLPMKRFSVAAELVNWTEAYQWWRKVTFVYGQNKMQLLSTELFTVVCLKTNATSKKDKSDLKRHNLCTMCRVLLNILCHNASLFLCFVQFECVWMGLHSKNTFNLFLVCPNYTIVVMFNTKAHYCFSLNFFVWPTI